MPSVFAFLYLNTLPATFYSYVQCVHYRLVSRYEYIDDASVSVTQKSVSDHGISALAGEDCALWRVLQEGSICKPEETVLVSKDRDQTDF